MGLRASGLSWGTQGFRVSGFRLQAVGFMVQG